MTLFVGGIHAVGKTYILKPVCDGLGLRHATASQLIKEQRGLTNWTTSRQVDDIDENQRALIAAVKRLEENGENIILDGHFVLRRGVDIHEKIGLETFSQLMVQGVILLEAPTKIVADRLVQRGDRTWALAEIEVFAQKELEHAAAVCRELGVPLVRQSSPTEIEMRGTIKALLA